MEQLTRALGQLATLPSMPALRRERIKLQVALLNPLIHVKGYAALETKAAAELALLLIKQAEALGEPPDDPLLLFSVLYGFWSASCVAFDGDALRELAAHFLELAEKQGATVPLVIGHRLMATALAYTGDLTEGRAHYDKAVTLYNPATHRALAIRFGQDHRVTSLSFRSGPLWMLGYPEAALADTEHALEDAREIGQAPTLMFALYHASTTQAHCGYYAAANERADMLIALAEDKGSLFWKSYGMMLKGMALALTGKVADAVQLMASGLTAYRSTGSTVFQTLFLSSLARGHADLGQSDGAWRHIAEAISAVEATKERLFEAEVNRIAGEIARLSSVPDLAKAEAYFERALAVARQQQAKSCGGEHGPAMARSREAASGPRTSCTRLRMVHRGF
jgi:predicted ATPase